MSSARPFSLPSRFIAFLFFALLSFAGMRGAHSQTLHFVPVLYTIPAIEPSSTNPLFSSVSMAATDVAGNFYFVGNARIQKMDPTGIVSVFAGTGLPTYTGDGGPATQASFESVAQLATDTAGNVYIADISANVVRKIDRNAIISTFAGNGSASSSGDGGLATAASLTPIKITTDATGNVYVVDINSSTIREITTDGMIKTVAGGGTLTGLAAEDAPATSVSLQPGDMATDSSGNLYVANGVNLSKIQANSGHIATIAGNSTYTNSGDGGLAINAGIRISAMTIDVDGNIYIADYQSKTVRRIDVAGTITTVVGQGFAFQMPNPEYFPANKAGIDAPGAIAVDPLGNLYVTVSAQQAVYKVVTHPERFPQTIVGAKSPTQILAVETASVAPINFTSFTLGNDFQIDIAGIDGEGGACSQTAQLQAGFSNNYCTFAVQFVPTAEGIRSSPLTINSNDTPGTLVQTLTSTGLGPALAMTSGQMVIVAGNGKGGTYVGDGGPATAANIGLVGGIALDNVGDLFLSSPGSCQIRRVDGFTGTITTIGGDATNCNALPISGDNGPALHALIPGGGSLALDSSNTLYISDTVDGRIRTIDLGGTIRTLAGQGIGSGVFGGYTSVCAFGGDGGPAVNAYLCYPGQVAISQNSVFVADTGNNVIRRIDLSSGQIHTVAGDFALNPNYSGTGSYSGDGGSATLAALNQPQGLVIDTAGNMFIGDTYNNVIRRVDATTGIITTFAGKPGTPGYSGDGGPASKALMFHPWGLAMDAAGNLFFSDESNYVVRKIDPSGIITTVAGNHGIGNGLGGNDLAATATTLYYPTYLAVGPGSHLFIDDNSNGLVREVSPNGSLLFPPTGLTSTSAPETITLSNIGNTPLHFDAQIPEAVSGDFAIDTGGSCDFSSPLPAGASCSVNVTFTPTAAGPRNGIFGFYQDGVLSPQYTELLGSGLQRQPQQIVRFGVPPTVSYNNPPFQLVATTSSGLPATFSIVPGSGTSATVTSSGKVTPVGIGPVTIAADQAGNGTFLPAPQQTSTLYVQPGEVTMTATGSSVAGQPIVPLIVQYSGLVNGDTPSVFTGKPLVSTTATSSSPAGSYPISITAGTLSATDYYVYSPAFGTYTVTPAPPPLPAVAITVNIYSMVQLTNHSYTAVVNILNGGSQVAKNVVITSFKLGPAMGTQQSGAALPENFGSVGPSGESTFINFPATAGNAGAVVIGTVAGTYTGGSFGGSFHYTLP